jgi:hypothetical protein
VKIVVWDRITNEKVITPVSLWGTGTVQQGVTYWMQMLGNMHCSLEDLQFVGGVQYKRNAACFGPKHNSSACYETATLCQCRP